MNCLIFMIPRKESFNDSLTASQQISIDLSSPIFISKISSSFASEMYSKNWFIYRTSVSKLLRSRFSGGRLAKNSLGELGVESDIGVLGFR